MKDSTILIIGAGVFLGFLGFLSYLSFLSSKQQPYVEPTPTYVPVYSMQQQKAEPVETEEVAPTKPHIMNHILTNADTWYQIPIPKDIRTWSMNARGTYDITYSFEPSHATYRTLFSGMFLDSDTSPNNISEIYVSSGTAGAVVEISMFR